MIEQYLNFKLNIVHKRDDEIYIMLFHKDHINYEDMNRRTIVHPDNYPKLYSIIKTLSKRAGVLKPTLYILKDHRVGSESIISSKIPSVPATPYLKNDPSGDFIIITTGALHKLSKSVWEAMISHELGHIKINGMQQIDDKYEGITSKQDEALADKIGASITSPQAMIDAIKYYHRHIISNPADSSTLDTKHPADFSRIKNLKKIAKAQKDQVVAKQKQQIPQKLAKIVQAKKKSMKNNRNQKRATQHNN